MALFGSDNSAASSSPSTSQEVKDSLIRQVQQEAAMSNARSLIGKVNEHCFEACVPTPGSSLSTKESTCLSQCMEKYIGFWNATSRAYISRVSKESKKAGGADLSGLSL
ncbi:protein translocase subunit TIM13 [Aspergillus homomorphus CBS 101889]|uniref:Mitochondrial import inner membrane translocase subunit n=1 Tax=Aspergillus homomorphus (strain CBS 101889) TaxID=1450537 RepID=A0A395IEX1_ASPHC|nr:putative mitochondrial intermembrane space translocase subunit Tim13 [Aspergillus homomorphus CBS 101889]RAL17733.1 putative mitochondrial intermembrane space translocase subunit Tim13 [Aspergillus homomorphus CBS 101889]